MRLAPSLADQGFDVGPSEESMREDHIVLKEMIAQKRAKQAYYEACHTAHVRADAPSARAMEQRMKNVSFFRNVARLTGRCPEAARRRALSGTSPDDYFAESGGVYQNGFATLRGPNSY